MLKVEAKFMHFGFAFVSCVLTPILDLVEFWLHKLSLSGTLNLALAYKILSKNCNAKVSIAKFSTPNKPTYSLKRLDEHLKNLQLFNVY